MTSIRELVQHVVGVSDMEKWLDNASEKVRRNVTVVTPEEVHQGFMMHISINPNIKEFIPMIGHRQAPSEDRTIPRVTVATTLFGCIIGYAQALMEFQYALHDKKKGEFNWRSGWYIYQMDFEQALKPSKALVFDQALSDEHWLVAYNPKNSSYLADKIGKIFFRSIRYVGNGKTEPTGEVEAYLEVNHLDGIHFSKNIHLASGFWKIEFPYLDHKLNAWDKDKKIIAKRIERREYLEVKNESAALLDFQEKTPSYMYW